MCVCNWLEAALTRNIWFPPRPPPVHSSVR